MPFLLDFFFRFFQNLFLAKLFFAWQSKTSDSRLENHTVTSRDGNETQGVRGWKREGRSGEYDAVKERRTNSRIDT